MRSMLFSSILTVTLTLATAATAFADSTSRASVSREADVVRAVGVVRYFHPHDAVTEVDWNRVLQEGFRLADSESDDDAFAAALATLLGRVGDGISPRSGADTSPAMAAPRCPSEDTPVRWVHEGFGAEPASGNGPYRSWRSGLGSDPEPSAFSTAMKDLPARGWRGQTLSFSSEVRLPDGGEAALWVRIRDAESKLLYFDNMDQQRIDNTEWADHSLQFEVPEAAERVAIGLLAHGPALAEFRRIRVQRVDEAAGETHGESWLSDPEQWQAHSAGISHALNIDSDDQGTRVRLEPQQSDPGSPEAIPESLADAPAMTEVPLLDGSRLRVPMVLCPRQAKLSSTDREQLAKDFPVLDIESLSQRDRARLDVAVLWPVLQHFYPYREQMRGWPDALGTALAESRSVDNADEHRRLLQRLTFHLADGHVSVYPAARESGVGSAWLPIAVESVNGELIVSRAHGVDEIRPGDRISAIDGEPASEWLERELIHHSGSRAWRTYLAINALLHGPQGDTRTLALRRDVRNLQYELTFDQADRHETQDHPPSTTLAGGIAYVNLHGMPSETMAELIPALAKAPGVIFDLRGYPRDHGFLAHLLKAPDDFQGWMRILLARAPDGELGMGAAYEWGLQPARPRIESPAVFLINHRALSYSESIIGLVKRHKLATLVGSNTGGANGNVLALHLPGGFVVRYTGMHVLGPDGEPFHATGIKPDIHVVPTVEGLKDGRDEVLERALQLFE